MNSSKTKTLITVAILALSTTVVGCAGGMGMGRGTTYGSNSSGGQMRTDPTNNNADQTTRPDGQASSRGAGD